MTDALHILIARADAFVHRGLRAAAERVDVVLDVYWPDGRRAVVIQFGRK